MIQKILWKNLQAVQLENKFLRVVVIPQLGGKVASVFEKEKEFELTAQNAAERYDLPESDADFSVFDASGIDDTFPNINEEIYRGEGSEYHYPDHGEVWSSNLNWNAQEDVLHLWYESERFFYLYEKWIFLEENQLCIRYRICNLSEKKTAVHMDVSWFDAIRGRDGADLSE